MSSILVEPGALLAAAETYEELVEAMTARRRALGLSQRDVDAIAGFEDGYCAKIEMSAGSRSRHLRALGRQTLPLLLAALGVRLVLAAGGAAGQASHLGRAAGKTLPLSDLDRTDAKKFLADWGRKGGRIRAVRMTAQQRRASARKAARARWAKRAAT